MLWDIFKKMGLRYIQIQLTLLMSVNISSKAGSSDF